VAISALTTSSCGRARRSSINARQYSRIAPMP
jgi:hypothetical protein